MQPLNPTDPALQQHFVAVAQRALLPSVDERRAAEEELKLYRDRVDQQYGFVELLLQICANSAAPDDARSLLGTYLKNTIRNGWDPSNAEHLIQDSEKEVIKSNIFEVMKASPSYMQRHLAEAITLIAGIDFPSRWQSIIGTMIQPLSDPYAPVSLIDVSLSTAHSLFIRYRKLEELTVETRDEIIAINAVFTKPLLFVIQRLSTEMLAPSPAAVVACKALTTAMEVLIDLISLDMGDEHEANLAVFMKVFLDSLRCNEAQLFNNGSGPLIPLKSAVLGAISLFVQRFDEEFEKYAPNMLQVVWEIVASPAYRGDEFDDLVISCLEVLTIACRSSIRTMFDDDEKVRVLCDQVVLPNLSLRESDVEMFDDSAAEYIERDIEGSDLHTRRRSACDLIQALLAVFPQRAGPIFMQEVTTLLHRYSVGGDWKAMDTAIFLVTALALQGSAASAQRGVKQSLNPTVPFETFLQSTVLPELSNPVAAPSHNIVKADAIRFVATFREHISPSLYPSVVQGVVNWLAVKHEVLYSYSSHAFERLLTVRDGHGLRFTEAQFQPMSGSVLSSLCTRLAVERVPNPYAMRCLMRIIKTMRHSSKSFVGDVVMCMNQVLIEASKNPANPIFNHCLFEVLSSCVSLSPELYVQIEAVLWPTFVNILANDVSEFVPYVLQVLAQLLDCHPAGEVLSEDYRKLAAPLVAPQMYEHKGTIPAVVRLLNSIIKQDPLFVHQSQLTDKILGVFRQLLQLKQHDHDGLSILTSMVLHFPKDVMAPFMPRIYQLLFERLSTSKTPKYVRILIIFFSVVVIVYGAEDVVNTVNNIQSGLFWMLLTRVWLQDMQKVTGALERKVCVVALASLLCDSSQLCQEEETWFQCVYCCLKMIHGAVEKDDVSSFVPRTASLEDLQQHQVADSLSSEGFSNVFCPLQDAVAKPEDPAVNIVDPNAHFRERLHALVAGPNGQVFVGRLQSRLSPELFQLIR